MIKKIKFYKALLIEIIETLASICRYIDYDSRGKYGNFINAHYEDLKYYSSVLREENRNGSKARFKRNKKTYERIDKAEE